MARDPNEDVAPLLRGIQPTGWLGAAAAAIIALPIWLNAAAMLLLGRWSSSSAVPPKERAGLKLQEPFAGLVEESVDVGGGVRLMAMSPGRRPDKPLLLLVHGFPECWYSWRHQMLAFREEYDVVAIDMRGYNKSDKPQGISSYSLDKLVADVPAVVRGLGHSTCTLLAHDWGGVVAWLVAASHPELVQRLVVLAAPHLGLAAVNLRTLKLSSLRQLLKSWYILLFQAPWLPELVLSTADYQAVSRVFTGRRMGVRSPGALTDLDIEWFKQSAQQPGCLTSALHYYRALLRLQTAWPIPSVWEAMRRRIRQPVLVLWGECDGALNVELMDNMEQVAPDVELHVLQGCSHWIQQERPQEVNTLIRAFLGRGAQVQS